MSCSRCRSWEAPTSIPLYADSASASQMALMSNSVSNPLHILDLRRASGEFVTYCYVCCAIKESDHLLSGSGCSCGPLHLRLACTASFGAAHEINLRCCRLPGPVRQHVINHDMSLVTCMCAYRLPQRKSSRLATVNGQPSRRESLEALSHSSNTTSANVEQRRKSLQALSLR